MGVQAKQATWPFVLLVALAIGLWLKDQWRAESGAPAAREVVESGRYERIEGCKWVEHRGNDGDSFRLRLPDGRVEEFRLYFVDTPESAFRNYGGGRNNHERIDQQARAMGISAERAVEVGAAAKKFVHDLLGRESLTIFTEWDDPFDDRRFHAFVETPGGELKWLHERLVAEGLVRIHTKGGELPDGTGESRQERRLRELEQQARKAGKGAWGD